MRFQRTTFAYDNIKKAYCGRNKYIGVTSQIASQSNILVNTRKIKRSLNYPFYRFLVVPDSPICYNIIMCFFGLDGRGILTNVSPARAVCIFNDAVEVVEVSYLHRSVVVLFVIISIIKLGLQSNFVSIGIKLLPT